MTHHRVRLPLDLSQDFSTGPASCCAWYSSQHRILGCQRHKPYVVPIPTCQTGMETEDSNIWQQSQSSQSHLRQLLQVLEVCKDLFELKKSAVMFRAHRNHQSFHFHQGVELDTPTFLEGSGRLFNCSEQYVTRLSLVFHSPAVLEDSADSVESPLRDRYRDWRNICENLNGTGGNRRRFPSLDLSRRGTRRSRLAAIKLQLRQDVLRPK